LCRSDRIADHAALAFALSVPVAVAVAVALAFADDVAANGYVADSYFRTSPLKAPVAMVRHGKPEPALPRSEIICDLRVAW